MSAPAARATEVVFVLDTLVVQLKDGRAISVPVAWFPRLRDATPAQRANWELIADGIGVRWPDLDEDISVAGLLGLND